MPGRVETIQSGNRVTITLDADNADVSAGGNGQSGDLILLDADGNEFLRLSIVNSHQQTFGRILVRRSTGSMLTISDALSFRRSDETVSLTLNSAGLTVNHAEGEAALEIRQGIKLKNESSENITVIERGRCELGGGGVDGLLKVFDENGETRIHVGGSPQSAHRIQINAEGKSLSLDEGRLDIRNVHGLTMVLTNEGDINAGGHGEFGRLSLRDRADTERIVADAEEQRLVIANAAGTPVFDVNKEAEVRVGGGKDKDGGIFVLDKDGLEAVQLKPKGNFITLKTTGGTVFKADDLGRLTLGGDGTHGGRINLQTPDALATTATMSSDGELVLGGGGPSSGATGVVTLRKSDGQTTASLTSGGDLFLGGNSVAGEVKLYPSQAAHSGVDQWTIHLDGQQGDIFLRNADCAEDFDVADAREADPGTVMVIDPEGKLKGSCQAYDKRVAGVISGAGKHRPGIVLDKQNCSDGRKPVALVGKVYCKVDAAYGAVEVGDLLTTSATRGHAMKASDPLRSFGAVIGKALAPIPAGRGLIPILIALQ